MHPQAEAYGALVGLGLTLFWGVLAGLYYLNPLLPAAFLSVSWGFAVGLLWGAGISARWVWFHTLALPLMLTVAGYQMAAWPGVTAALLQSAHMLDFALLVAILTAAATWKTKVSFST